MDGHEIPCHIDHHSFMPLLTCFHDADETAKSIANNVQDILDADNKTLTKPQKVFKKFHDKLGHVGFQHLKWILSRGLFGAIGIRCSQSDVVPPKCQSCIHGGQERENANSRQHTYPRSHKQRDFKGPTA